jgi:hypothetical protein
MHPGHDQWVVLKLEGTGTLVTNDRHPVLLKRCKLFSGGAAVKADVKD